MYFIINISKPPRTIILADLGGLEIGPKKAMDISKFKTKVEIDESKDLQRAIKQRLLQVRHSKIKPQPQQLLGGPSTGVSDDDIAKIQKAVQEQLKGLIPQQPQPAPQPQVDQSAILQQMESLKDLIMSQRHQGVGDGGQVDDYEEDGIDEEKLAEIHAKAVRKRAVNTTGHVKHEVKQKKDSVKSKVDELEDLLGG